MIGLNYLGKMGQLGNQMFQYAALLGVADKLGVGVCIPNHKEAIVDVLGNTLRIELFDAFDLEPDHLGYIKGDAYQEKHYHYDGGVFDIDPSQDTCLVGYWQSEKYFLHIKEKIKKVFAPKKEVVEECEGIVDVLDNPVSLRVRRGDFLINYGNHHNVSMNYYEKALSEFPDRQVVIFSDDPAWCMDHSLFADDRFIVSEGNGPYHDLYLMSQCSDFIIPASTFSWWGAWLADRGTVICPQKWFGPNNADKSIEDLYPPHWKVIPYS